jgi:hypothetical protein
MIYTAYEMARDCRENRPEGWRYLARNYVPVIRKVLAHYAPAAPAPVERILTAVARPDSGLFSSVEPGPERQFVAELRQKALAELAFRAPEIPIDLEAIGEAWAPLTIVEKQAAWTEGMRYAAPEAGAMLRMAPATVEKIRERAAELLRGKVDSWSRKMLAENGLTLGREAAAARGPECLPAKAFLDVLDGRTTWFGREQMERHVAGCLHCIDHFCRMAEVIELLRGAEPLGEEEAAPYYRVLGVGAEKKGWRRLTGAQY